MIINKKQAVRIVINKFASLEIDKEYQKFLISRSDHNDLIEYVLNKSYLFTNEIKKKFRAFHIDIYFEDILVLLIPTYKFVIDSSLVCFDRYRFIVLSDGFLDLINLLVTNNVLHYIANRKHELQGMPNEKQQERIKDINDLFLKIVASQCTTTRTIPIKIPIEIRDLFQNFSLLQEANFLIFLVLHEIGHINLGHAKRLTWIPKQIIYRDLLVSEKTNK